MEINIIDDRKNPLLSRREIICMVTKKGTTPSKNDIATQVSNELKLKRECVFIDAVYQKYGRPASEVHVKVYDKKELVPGYEKQKKDTDSAEAKKEDGGEGKAPEEAKEAPEKKEKVKEEKPKETPEKKEEVKEEPKKEEVKEEKAQETPEKKEEVKEEKKEEPKKEETAPDTEKKEEASKKDDTKKE